MKRLGDYWDAFWIAGIFLLGFWALLVDDIPRKR